MRVGKSCFDSCNIMLNTTEKQHGTRSAPNERLPTATITIENKVQDLKTRPLME